jgi:hypothetical protein
MQLRHWQPNMDRSSYIDDLNEWMRKVTKDPQHSLILQKTRMSLRELEIICYAISCAEEQQQEK